MNNKRKWAVIGSILLMTVLSIITAYFLMTMYYRGKFAFGTYINGVYCTGKTVEEVNSLLCEQYTERRISVIVEDGSTEELVLDRTVFTPDYTMGLERIMEKQAHQNPIQWGKRFFTSQHEVVEAEITYDEEVLLAQIALMPCTNHLPDELLLYIGLSENGYALMDTTQEYYDPVLATWDIQRAILDGKTTVDMAEEGCYSHQLYIDNGMQAIYDEWAEVQAFQKTEIRYVMGSGTETIGPEWMAKFLVLNDADTPQMFLKDESGNFTIDEIQVRMFVDEFADRYDTYGMAREFTTIHGQTVTVDGSIYGNQIDREAEVEWLLETLRSGQGGVRTPQYTQMAKYQGSDDIGPTYIEIDLTAQKLYLIKNHEIALETDIVSGNLGWRLGTPSRVCYIHGRYKNRVLTGPDYASFVYYWMPVYRNIGIHDATWRNRFGGDIYKTNGSHGCINVPLEKMEILYGEVERGIPVVMYYTEEMDMSRINNK